jgi:hypothetical protein
MRSHAFSITRVALITGQRFAAARSNVWAMVDRMSDELLLARDVAKGLRMSITSLYGWLGMSDRGLLFIRGQQVTIRYFQGGPNGQGRIMIESSEVDRIKDAMRVQPQWTAPRSPFVRRDVFPGITVKLGRPRG